MVKKALSIAEVFYLDYLLLFLFDNEISHFVYAKDTFQAKDMNKQSGRKKPILRDRCFDWNGVWIIHPMNFQQENGQWIQKKIQKVLEERQIWPIRGQKLSYPKLKCFNCWVAADCKICIKGHKYNICKNLKDCSLTNCSKNWQYDAFVHRKDIYQYVTKKYCTTCLVKKGKCGDCENLPFKCTIDSNFFLISC